MKKITCREMGGCCDVEVQGENAEELMQKGIQHVHGLADSGDEEHGEVVKRMQALGEEGKKKWTDDFKANFDSLQDA